MAVSVYSFDIFDTLLVRACGRPQPVFDILASRILGEDAPWSVRADFAAIRLEAENKARQQFNRVPKLEDIYKAVMFSAVTDAGIDTLMATEMQVESDMLKGVDSMRAVVEDCRRKGKVVFTSDMYLPSSFLREVLTREGFYKAGDPIFVSCEHNATKSEGGLFRIMKEATGADKIHHFGDNFHSDVKMVKRAVKGMPHRVRHDFSFYERFTAGLPDTAQQNRPEILASISKAVRLTRQDNPQATLFAADIIAPNFVPVTYELMKRAYDNGIRRLFFLARDGKILYKIAERLTGLFPGLEIAYVYLSRTSLYLPSIPEINARTLEDIFSPMAHTGHSRRRFLEKYAPGANLQLGDGANDFSEILKESGVRDKLTSYHREQRELLREYFVKSGLASDNAMVGVVDLNASGATVAFINRFLAGLGYKPTKGYVYSCSPSRLRHKDAGQIEAIKYLERSQHNIYKRSEALIYIMEDYAAATDHGRTTHYERDAQGNVAPVLELESESESQTNTNTFRLNSEVCRLYADLWVKSHAYENNAYNIAISEWTTAHFARNPRPEYLRILTGRGYDKEGLESKTIVRKLTVGELKRLLKLRGHYDSWARGSIVATFGLPGQWLISALGKMKQTYRKLR